MKKMKIILIIAGILCSVGLFTCAVSWFVLGMDYTRLDLSENLNEQAYTAAVDEVTEIQVDSKNYGVQVVQSTDADIHLRYFLNDTVDAVIENNGGRLQLAYQDRWNWRNMFQMFRGLKNIKNVITVQVPLGYPGEIMIKSDNGRIWAEDLRVGNNLAMESENAGVMLEDVVCNEVKALSRNGSVGGEDIRVTNTLIFTAENGRISLESVHANRFELTSENGRITVEESTAAEKASIKNQNGSIKLEQIASRDFDFQNENGSISGTIAGRKEEYQINCTTKNGSCNLENRLDKSAPCILQARSENGSIRLKFEEPVRTYDD